MGAPETELRISDAVLGESLTVVSATIIRILGLYRGTIMGYIGIVGYILGLYRG